MSFGDELRALRQTRGLSLAELAKLTHYSKGYLSKLENGTKPSSPELAQALDTALKGSGGLVDAAVLAEVAKADSTPWQTAELVQRLAHADVSPIVLEGLNAAVIELCCQYSYRDAESLRAEAQGWVSHIGDLLQRPVGIKTHSELMNAAGWLALLIGCVEWDMGLKASGEFTRRAALQIATESGNFEQAGWAHEMTAWFAYTEKRYADVIAAARAGQEMTRGTSVHVQLIGQESKALAAMGSHDLPRLLESGRAFLEKLNTPTRPDNHFVIDPKKLDFYEMDAYRLAGDDARTKEYGEIVVRDHPDGDGGFPMRVTQAKLALALVAAREGDLEAAVGQAMSAINRTHRRSVPSFGLLCREVAAEIQRRFPGEVLTDDFIGVVRDL